MNIPFGMTENEWNKFCDTQKCKYGNYCNSLIGLCHRCKKEKVEVEVQYDPENGHGDDD